MNRAHLFVILLATLSAAPLALSGAEAADNWTQHCVRCHGADGKGATKMGRRLKLKDLTAERTQRRLSDEEIAELIAAGYKDNDGGERMPAFADKLSPQERAALVLFVRSFNDGPR